MTKEANKGTTTKTGIYQVSQEYWISKQQSLKIASIEEPIKPVV